MGNSSLTSHRTVLNTSRILCHRFSQICITSSGRLPCYIIIMHWAVKRASHTSHPQAKTESGLAIVCKQQGLGHQRLFNSQFILSHQYVFIRSTPVILALRTTSRATAILAISVCWTSVIKSLIVDSYKILLACIRSSMIINASPLIKRMKTSVNLHICDISCHAQVGQRSTGILSSTPSPLHAGLPLLSLHCFLKLSLGVNPAGEHWLHLKQSLALSVSIDQVDIFYHIV